MAPRGPAGHHPPQYKRTGWGDNKKNSFSVLFFKGMTLAPRTPPHPVSFPRAPGDPGNGVPGTGRIREGSGRSGKVPGGSGTIFRVFGSFLPETGYSESGARILTKNYIYGLQDHRKWMKVDPFRAHLKFGQQKKLDGGRAIAPLHAKKKN